MTITRQCAQFTIEDFEGRTATVTASGRYFEGYCGRERLPSHWEDVQWVYMESDPEFNRGDIDRDDITDKLEENLLSYGKI